MFGHWRTDSYVTPLCPTKSFCFFDVRQDFSGRRVCRKNFISGINFRFRSSLERSIRVLHPETWMPGNEAERGIFSAEDKTKDPSLGFL